MPWDRQRKGWGVSLLRTRRWLLVSNASSTSVSTLASANHRADCESQHSDPTRWEAGNRRMGKGVGPSASKTVLDPYPWGHYATRSALEPEGLRGSAWLQLGVRRPLTKFFLQNRNGRCHVVSCRPTRLSFDEAPSSTKQPKASTHRKST